MKPVNQKTKAILAGQEYVWAFSLPLCDNWRTCYWQKLPEYSHFCSETKGLMGKWEKWVLCENAGMQEQEEVGWASPLPGSQLLMEPHAVRAENQRGDINCGMSWNQLTGQGIRPTVSPSCPNFSFFHPIDLCGFSSHFLDGPPLEGGQWSEQIWSPWKECTWKLSPDWQIKRLMISIREH